MGGGVGGDEQIDLRCLVGLVKDAEVQFGTALNLGDKRLELTHLFTLLLSLRELLFCRGRPLTAEPALGSRLNLLDLLQLAGEAAGLFVVTLFRGNQVLFVVPCGLVCVFELELWNDADLKSTGGRHLETKDQSVISGPGTNHQIVARLNRLGRLDFLPRQTIELRDFDQHVASARQVIDVPFGGRRGFLDFDHDRRHSDGRSQGDRSAVFAGAETERAVAKLPGIGCLLRSLFSPLKRQLAVARAQRGNRSSCFAL